MDVQAELGALSEQRAALEAAQAADEAAQARDAVTDASAETFLAKARLPNWLSHSILIHSADEQEGFISRASVQRQHFCFCS